MQVFEPFSGTMLSVVEEPTILQGDFDFTRSVLIEFPSAEKAMAWMTSSNIKRLPSTDWKPLRQCDYGGKAETGET